MKFVLGIFRKLKPARTDRTVNHLGKKCFFACHRYRSIYFYRPQTKFAKVMFLHVCVRPQGGGEYLVRYITRTRYTPWTRYPPSPQTRYTPPDQVPPWTTYTPRQVHPPDQVPPGPGTPPRQVHPPDQVHPWTRYTPDQVPPWTRYTPPDQVHPPDQVNSLGRYTPRPGTPPHPHLLDQVHPQTRYTPPEQYML